MRFGPVPKGLRRSVQGIENDEFLRTLLQTAIQGESLDSFVQSRRLPGSDSPGRGRSR